MPSSRPPRVPSPSEPPGGPERRQHTRAPIELKVEYKRLNSFFADYTRNISNGGTFIMTSKPLPVGTEFLFQLTIPNLEKPLELHGKVAWVVTADQVTPMQPAGMGIRFQYRHDGEREAVAKTVEKLIVESLGPFLGRKLIELKNEDK